MKWEGLLKALLQSSIPHFASVDKTFQSNNALYWSDQMQFCFISDSCVSLLWQPMNYLNNPIASFCGNQGGHPTPLIQNLPAIAPVVHSVPSLSTADVWSCMVSCYPGPWVSVNNTCYCSHLSGVGYCVFGYLSNPRVGIPLSSVGWEGGD